MRDDHDGDGLLSYKGHVTEEPEGPLSPGHVGGEFHTPSAGSAFAKRRGTVAKTGEREELGG
jgi:hypothetical protein